MDSFEQLQLEKAERAAKLLALLPRLGFLSPDSTENLSVLTDNFNFLLSLVKEQRKLCNDQRVALLEEEIRALEGKKDGVSLVNHVSSVPNLGSLDVSRLRSALVLIASRKNSLNMLK